MNQIRTSTSSNRPSRRKRPLLLLVLLAVALSGCGVTASADGGSASSPGGAGDGATDGGGAPEGPEGRAIRYGYINVEIDGHAETDEHPAGPDQAAEDVSYESLDVSITNRATSGDLSLPPGIFQLDVGLPVPVQAFLTDGGGIGVGAGRTEDATLWFEVPDESDGGQALVIQEGTSSTLYEPAVLPLEGDLNPEQRVDVQVPAVEFFDRDIKVGVELGSAGAWLDFDVALDDDGRPAAGQEWASGLGRAPAGRAFLHLPGQAEGTPVQPVPLSFNAINYGIPALATAEGANNPVADTFPDLDGRFTGEFAVFVTEGAKVVDFRIGCPCGGLLTGSTIEDELLRVSVDVSAASSIRHET